MSDSCVCSYIDASDYSCDFCSQRIITARKKHRCIECSRTIEYGEKYEYTFGVWDGSPSVYKTCEDCLSVRNVFFCEGHYFSEVWYDTYDTVREAILCGDMPLGQLDGLTNNAKLKIIKYIDEVLQKEDGND